MSKYEHLDRLIECKITEGETTFSQIAEPHAWPWFEAETTLGAKNPAGLVTFDKAAGWQRIADLPPNSL